MNMMISFRASFTYSMLVQRSNWDSISRQSILSWAVSPLGRRLSGRFGSSSPLAPKV